MQRPNRRTFVAGALASLAAGAADRPSVVLLIAPSWTGEIVETKNLSLFARDSLAFTRAYAADPAEWPAAASLLTGEFPHATGIASRNHQLLPGVPSMASAFKAAGYSTAYFGTWQLDGDGPTHRGFDIAEAPDPPAFARWAKQARTPVFAMVHWSATAGASYTDDLARADAILGQFLSAVRSAIGMTGITVMTSDRGVVANLWSDRSSRVPLFIRYPGKLQAGDTNDFLVSSVDVAPTLLSWCGVSAPGRLQGRDLAPLLANPQSQRPDSIYAEGSIGQPDEWRMMVNGWDKLVTTPDAKPLYLFNLAEDESENRNLVRDPSRMLKVDELITLIQIWMKRTADGIDASGLRKR